MSSTLETKFTGDSKSLEAAYEKIARENVKLREELKKTHDAHKEGADAAEKATEQLSEAISEQAQELVQMAMGWATVEKAVDAASEAYKRQIELENKAAEIASDTGGQRPSVIRNMGPVSQKQRREMFEELEARKLTMGFNEQEMDALINYSLSVSGGDRERALALAGEAAKLAPEGGQAASSVAFAIEQVSEATGDHDIKRSAGRLAEMQDKASIPDTANIAGNMAPAIGSMIAEGATFEEGAALFASIAKTMGDTEGSRTRTPTANLVGNMAKFFDPEEQRKRAASDFEHALSPGFGEHADHGYLANVRAFLGQKGIRDASLPKDDRQFAEVASELLKKDHPEWAAEFMDRQAASLPSPHGVTEQLHLLQNDKELHDAFLKAHPPEARSRGAELELLRAGSHAAQIFEDTQSQLKGADYAKSAEKEEETIATEPSVIRRQMDRGSDVLLEQLLGGDYKRADLANARKKFEVLQNTLAPLGANWVDSGVFTAKAWMGADPGQMYHDQAAMAINRLRFEKAGASEGTEADYADPFEAEKRGVLKRTSDGEKNRKANVIERDLDRWDELRALKEKGDAEQLATEEETPAAGAQRAVDEGRAKPSAPRNDRWSPEDQQRVDALAGEHGLDRRQFTPSGSDLNSLEREKQELLELDQHLRGEGTIDEQGNYTNTKHKASQHDIKEADSLAPLLAKVDRMIEILHQTMEQQGKQHREKQAGARSGAARVAAGSSKGRESN